jgi:hypothetical protein
LPTYKQYRNQLTNIIRQAKFNYHKQTEFKNSSSKLWSHLKSLIKSNSKTDIPIDADTLNDYFSSVFKQAPRYQPSQHPTIPQDTFVTQSIFLLPVSDNEVISTLSSISNSNATGSDGILPEIIKLNATHIAPLLTYIFNLSFSQGLFPNLLKEAVVIPVFKGGSHRDPSNYRPILTLFSKLLEKLQSHYFILV